jgi:2',3'-cyclic-nucleotide 2'-phosphodiesterase (5'-nucleotidase family)
MDLGIRIFISALFFIPYFFFPFLLADQSESFELNIFFTNDIHGGIVPVSAEFLNPEFPPMLGGGASAASIIKKAQEQIEARGDALLLIDSGDIFQGTLVGTLSKGTAMIEYMNMIGYQACVPGNHDFDLGAENLAELIRLSNFPWISCNIVDQETGQIWPPLKEYIVVEKNGVKIGITGTTTISTEKMSFPDNIRGLQFLSEIPALQSTVDQLRFDEKVDMVLALVHTGLPYDVQEGYRELQQATYEKVTSRSYVSAMEIARFVKGIDILLGGHLHRGYQEPWIDPLNHTICIQNYGNGGNLGWLKLTIENKTRSIMGYDYPADRSSLLLLQEDEFWPDSVIAAYVRSQQDIYEQGFQEVIGITQTALTRAGVSESPMYNLVTDAMRQRTNSDFGFNNFGGIRADIKAGPITQEDVFKVLPFGNQVVVFQASGRFLMQIMESKLEGKQRGLAISGGQITYNSLQSDGDKITRFMIDGKPLEAEKIYRIATTDYLMEGNSGLMMLKSIPAERVAYTGILLREAVIEYIRDNSPLKVEIDGRWNKKDDSTADPEWKKNFQESSAALTP